MNIGKQLMNFKETSTEVSCAVFHMKNHTTPGLSLSESMCTSWEI